MGPFSVGQIVFVSYPYSDFTKHKQRPAILIAHAGREDWICCQVTSNPYAIPSPRAIPQSFFSSGGLDHLSFARPQKLSTLNEEIFTEIAGTLNPAALAIIREAIIRVLTGTPPAH